MSVDTVSYIVLGVLSAAGVLPTIGWIAEAQARRAEVVRNEQLRREIEALKRALRERDEAAMRRTEGCRLSEVMMRASRRQWPN